MNSEIIDATILEEIEVFSVQIAREAGHILLDHFNKPLEVSYKGKNDTDPVTEADRSSDVYLKQAIKGKYPEHNIVSEEGGISSQSSSPFTWVLDPLDGTANFINGLPFFAVSVGVLWKNQPVIGSIYFPASHETTEGVYHTFLINLAGFPAHISPGDTLFVTTLPAPTIEPFPILISPRMVALLPKETLLPIYVLTSLSIQSFSDSGLPALFTALG